jgi:Oxidoreductase NAD-binding domain
VTGVGGPVLHDPPRRTHLEIAMRLSDKSRPLIEATLPVVGEHIEEIAEHFYQHLFTEYPELLDGTFNRGNQAKGTQQQALAGSVAAFGRPMVFISAGIGITPMAGMLSHLAQAGSQLPVMLLHADLSEDYFALRHQVLSDITALAGASIYVWYEQGAASQQQDIQYEVFGPDLWHADYT